MRKNNKRRVRIIVLATIVSLMMLAIGFPTLASNPPKSDGTLLAQNFESGFGGWTVTKSANGIGEIVSHTGSSRLHLKAAATGDYAYISSGSFTNSNDAYIVDFDYYKPSGVTNTDWHIYGSWNSTASNWNDIRILNTGSSLTVSYGSGGYTTLSYTLPTDQWVHFTIWKQSASVIKLYINDVEYGTYAPITGSGSMTAVSYLGDPSYAGYQGEGYWDDFNVGLLATDPPKSDGTLQSQSFDSGIGSWSTYKSTNGTAEVIAHTGSSRLHLKSGSSADYAYASGNSFTNTNSSYVVEFDYYKPSGVTNTDWYIYSSWNSGASNWNDVRILNTGSTVAVYHAAGFTNLNYTLPTNRWVHFTLWKQSSNCIYVYIDGTSYGYFSPISNSINMTSVNYIGDNSNGAIQGEGYWDNFRIGILDKDPSNLAFESDFESGAATGWTTSVSGSGLVECVRLNQTYALHVKALNTGDLAFATSPHFTTGSPQYSVEFDYYKPSGVSAKDWHIYGAWNGSDWNDIRILQSDDVTQGTLTVFYGSGQYVTLSGYSLPANTWVRFLIIKNAAGNFELYIDGVYKGVYSPLSTSAGLMTNFGYLGDPSTAGYKGEGYWDNFKVTTATNAAVINTTAAYTGGGARTVQVKTPGSFLEFDGNGSDTEFAGFTANSTIRSLDLLDTYAPFKVAGFRWAGSARGTLHCHNPYKVEVCGGNSKITAFKAITTNDSISPIKARTTYYVFKDLPEVILMDNEFERVLSVINGETDQNSFTFQAYSKGDGNKYNGMRLWFTDPNPNGVKYWTGWPTEYADYNINPDGTNGVYLRWDMGNPNPYGDNPQRYAVWWIPEQLTRGLQVEQYSASPMEQYSGSNNWNSNPPAGFVFKKDNPYGQYVNTSNAPTYNSFVVGSHFSPDVPNVGDKGYASLYFFAARSSGNLTDMNKIYNLEESYRFPLQQAQLELSTASRPSVRMVENNSLARNWQIVVLPAEYNKIVSSLKNIYKGQPYTAHPTSTVALLKNVTAGSTTTIGELPITLAKISDSSYTADSRCDGTIKSVKVKITIPSGRTVTGVTHGGQAVTGYTVNGTELSYTRDVAPGNTSISIAYQ